MPVQHSIEGLRPIRKVRKVSPTELAERIGVEPNSYSRYERGERRIYLDQARALAHRLGVRIDDLVEPLTEDEATILINQRDTAAIAAGTFNKQLWAPGSKAEALPAEQAPPPPPGGSSEPVVMDELKDWQL